MTGRSSKRIFRLLLTLGVVWVLGHTFGLGMAAAQRPANTASTSAPAPAPVDIPPGFQPLVGREARAESVNANVLVVAAYGAVLVLLFGYVGLIVKRQSEISAEMKEIAAKLEKAQKP